METFLWIYASGAIFNTMVLGYYIDSVDKEEQGKVFWGLLLTGPLLSPLILGSLIKHCVSKGG